MKKILFILAMIVSAIALRAQTNMIAGQWLMTGAEVKGRTLHPYQIFDFKEDGTFMVMGMKVGTWKYDKGGNKIILKSKMDKDFNGASTILKLNTTRLVLDKNGDKYDYIRINPEKIATVNRQSGLAGIWKLNGTDYPSAFLKLDLPQDFTLIQSNAGETDKRRGSWLFRPKDKSVIFVGFSHLLRGKVKLINRAKDTFELQLSDRTLKAQRVKPDAQKIERLTFKEEDLPEEYKGPHQLPWSDFDQMVQFLSGVKSVEYEYGKLEPELNILKHTSVLVSKISVNTQKPSVDFRNFTVANGDSTQFSEKYKGNLQERYNNFFPQNELYPYRIVGIQKVTVPAGTFTCTVVEGMDTENKLKYWMINDMPGIYAKIIREVDDPFGKVDYSVMELKKINGIAGQ